MITGTLINYYFICKRKLWLSANNILMEGNSDLVKQGKLLHDQSYLRKRREIELSRIKFDYIDDNGVHEVKRSSKLDKAHQYQLLYYLQVLKERGLEKKGFLHYPKEKKINIVELTVEKDKELEKIKKDVLRIIKTDNPPKLVKKPYCKSCSYYELCWV